MMDAGIGGKAHATQAYAGPNVACDWIAPGCKGRKSVM